MFLNISLQGFGQKTVGRDGKILLNQPGFYLALVFVLGFFHIGLLYLGFLSPLALLFVPLIYLTCKANDNLNTTKNIFKHSMPFVVLSIINISFHVAGLLESAEFAQAYKMSRLVFTLIVSVFYLMLTFSLNRSNNISKNDKRSLLYTKLIGQLCILCWFMMCMGGIKLIMLLIGETDFGIIIKMLWLSLFISIRLLIGLTWFKLEKQSVSLQSENETENVVFHEDLNRNKVHLLHYLEQSEIFLNPDLTLPILAKKTGMSEKEFSKLLNHYIGQSFYHLIAKYRIAYAVKLIEENADMYTIDAMAGHCGFNSKTSFNKYFKEFTGSNPSTFRAKLSNK